MCRPLLLLGKPSCWALLSGVALLLAAITVVGARHDTAISTADLRWQTELTLTKLEGCGMCHVPRATSGPAVEQVAVVRTQHGRINLPVARAATEPAGAVLEPRLLELGERLLRLPVTDDRAYQLAAEGFLNVYAASRSASDPASVRQALAQLTTVEEGLRRLEHHAHPARVHAGGARSNDAPEALTKSNPPTAGASSGAALVVSVPGATRTVDSPQLLSLPALAVLLVRRRGPPSASAPTVCGRHGRSRAL